MVYRQRQTRARGLWERPKPEVRFQRGAERDPDQVAHPSSRSTKTALPSASGSAIVSTPPSSAVTPAPGSGPASSIAAASSMTAASVPSFAFPSAPLPTDSALAFIKKSWPYKSGTSDYLSFVVDPLGGTELVLEIDYPAGGYAEHNPGGVSGMHFDVFGAEGGMQRAIMSYEVRVGTGARCEVRLTPVGGTGRLQ